MFANTSLESSRIAIVPFGERFGVPFDRKRLEIAQNLMEKEIQEAKNAAKTAA